MCTAAEFLGEATDVDHTHDITVLFAEEGDDIVGLLVEGSFKPSDLTIVEQVLVAEFLNLGELFWFDCFEVGEVET